jgi:hypothetical protein
VVAVGLSGARRTDHLHVEVCHRRHTSSSALAHAAGVVGIVPPVVAVDVDPRHRRNPVLLKELVTIAVLLGQVTDAGIVEGLQPPISRPSSIIFSRVPPAPSRVTVG